MNKVLDDLLVKAIYAILGLAFSIFYGFFLKVLPTKRLWRLNNYKNLVISAATTNRTNTGQYYRPNTGLGELRALALLVTSLNKAYKNIEVKNIHLSEDQIHDRIENDFIIMGGPKNNKLSKLFLDKIQNLTIVNQVDDTIFWRAGNENIDFVPVVKEKNVIRDYGLIIRMKNPFSDSDKTICLFSGGHTYGVIAASKYFTENYFKRAKKWKKIGPNLVAVVCCDVLDGYPIHIRLEKEYIF